MQQGNPGGRRIIAGRYAVVGELGRGGMGIVWRAQDQVIGRQVALKELRIPPGLSTVEHDTFVQRVLREARTAGALNDPAIVTVHDVVPEGGAMYIVMELIEAQNLADLVARGGPLDPRRVSDIGLQVLSALDTAHAAGIVHRDIKPSNIMLLPGDRVKLTDFGIAQGTDDPSLTATGGMMGSPGYMAPELFQGRPPTPASDLWSLGATLFHVAEGRAPFERGNTAATLHAILYEEPHLSRVRGPLAGAITGLLVQQAEQRLTPGRLRDLLTTSAPTRAVAAPLPSEASTEIMPRIDDRTTVVDRTRQQPRPHRRKAVWLSAAAVLGVLALAGAAVALIGSRSNTVASPQLNQASTVVTPTTTAAPRTTAPTTTSTTTTTTRSTPHPLTYVAIHRYYDSHTHAHLTATPGTPIPKGFAQEKYNLGKLLAAPQPGTIKIFSCKGAGNDYFTSADQSGACDGHGNTDMALLGYVYKTPQGGDALTMYRCLTKSKPTMHYDSVVADCQGNGTKEAVEGYQPK